METDKTDKGKEVARDSVVDTEQAKAAADSAVESPQEVKSAGPEREPNFKDYIRVFSYAKKWDIALMIAAAIASAGAGITMPLMNLVLGKLVGNFNAFGASDAQILQSFSDILNQQSLYLLALFLARFGLNYINKAWRSKKPQVCPPSDY